MGKSLRERRLEKKKLEILRSAAAIVAEKGYHKTTMEDIANELLMTKGSMYYYFKSKEDLLFQCNMMILEPSIENIRKIKESDLSPLEKIKQVLTEFVLFEIKESTTFSLAHIEQVFSKENFEAIVEKRDEYNRIFDSILQEGIDKKVFVDLDVKMARLLLLGALNSIQLWYKPSGEKKPEEIAAIYTEYLMRILLFKQDNSENKQ